jgi:hypothetical protein
MTQVANMRNACVLASPLRSSCASSCCACVLCSSSLALTFFISVVFSLSPQKQEHRFVVLCRRRIVFSLQTLNKRVGGWKTSLPLWSQKSQSSIVTSKKKEQPEESTAQGGRILLRVSLCSVKWLRYDVEVRRWAWCSMNNRRSFSSTLMISFVFIPTPQDTFFNINCVPPAKSEESVRAPNVISS